RLTCEIFGISETCYRYQPKLSGDNAHIADWQAEASYSWWLQRVIEASSTADKNLCRYDFAW
ncbi:MAG: hypothetical protein AB2794_16850, partial [Candidatus Thiodiazotropha endolucinida]